jgi:hypothetical protein
MVVVGVGGGEDGVRRTKVDGRLVCSGLAGFVLNGESGPVEGPV